MQKMLEQIVKLTEVVSDILGVAGLAIIRAILEGERDPRTDRPGREAAAIAERLHLSVKTVET